MVKDNTLEARSRAVRASVSLPKEDWEFLEEYAQERQASVSWVIRRLVRKFAIGETKLEMAEADQDV